MTISSPAGGNTAGQAQKPALEYTAQAASPLVNGEVKLTIGGKALAVTALFSAVEIAYAEINALKMEDYTVTVESDSGEYIFTRLGSWCAPFYSALCDAYNQAVLRSLFIKDSPFLIAQGNYLYTENSTKRGGAAPIHVYENNVTVLPPDLSARRIPLCFVTGMEKGDFTLTLTLDTGDSYACSKLGYDTAPFADAIEKHIRVLRETSLAAVKEIDPTLTAAQASQLANLTLQGAAAPIGQLAEIAPLFTAALEKKINATRAAESYAVFKELCAPAQIWAGFRKSNDSDNSANEAADASGEPYMLWLIAPSTDGQYAAVEFAEANSATFIYRTEGDFPVFARQLNHALEAINFKREVIRLSEEELRMPENADYYMAAKRTAALQFVRSHFTSRIIHSSPEKWKSQLQEYFTK